MNGKEDENVDVGVDVDGDDDHDFEDGDEGFVFSDEEDDEEGVWITEDNVTHLAQDTGNLFCDEELEDEEDRVPVALITTDFAMQVCVFPFPFLPVPSLSDHHLF